MSKKQVNPKLMMAATLFLAVTAFAVGFFMAQERLRLLETGERADGTVIGVEVEFKTADGRRVIGRDLHKTQWFAANEKGEQVALCYDPAEPEKILVMRGIEIWSNPAFLLLGGFF